VTLGDLNVDIEEGTEVRRVANSSAFVVPSYFEEIGSRVFNDVALIRLSPPVDTRPSSSSARRPHRPRQLMPLPSFLSAAGRSRNGGLDGAEEEWASSDLGTIRLARHFADDYVGDADVDVGAEVVSWGRRSRIGKCK
jgi:hypothetical protein